MYYAKIGGYIMVLYITIPCYNEEEVLNETARFLLKKVKELISADKISNKSRIVFIDDGSKDRTWSIIEEIHKKDEIFSGVKLSCNRGHQNALLAGLMTVKDLADVVISMDADLQDDINAIDSMIEKYDEGCDIVYGVRSARTKDTFFKRFTAESFYKVMNVMGANIVFNHADYRLMSKKALEGFAEFKEVNLFLRGIIPMVGYKSDIVMYERGERFAGESKYPLKKMLTFAFEGITSLSTKPIKFITGLGTTILFISIIMIIYYITRYFTGNTVEGWATIVVSIWAFGGIQLMSIGLIGEYVGKIYLESKHRPRFIVDKFINSKG